MITKIFHFAEKKKKDDLSSKKKQVVSAISETHQIINYIILHKWVIQRWKITVLEEGKNLIPDAHTHHRNVGDEDCMEIFSYGNVICSPNLRRLMWCNIHMINWTRHKFNFSIDQALVRHKMSGKTANYKQTKQEKEIQNSVVSLKQRVNKTGSF